MDNSISGQTAVDYEISNWQRLCGQGNITTIKQPEGGHWKSYIGTDSTKLRCSLLHICSLTAIELKLNNVNMVQFTLYLDGDEMGNEMRSVNSREREGGIIFYYFKKRMERVDWVQVDLHSFNRKQIGVVLLRFWGTVVEVRAEKKKAREKKGEVDIFKQRVKEKEPKEKARVTEKLPIENKKIPNQNGHLNIYIPEGYPEEELVDPEQQEMPAKYTVKMVRESQIKGMEDVNEKWVESQRKMEASFGVASEHSLATKLSPKCFRGMKFCFANLYGEEKVRYIRMVKELGGLVKEQPCEGCIVVTSRPKDSPAVNLARIMPNTHIVKPAYIEECFRTRTKQKPSKYEFSLEQFFA